MTKHVASVQDQEEPRRQPRTSRQGKVVLIKKGTKKPARQKATKNVVAVADPLMNSPSTNDDMQTRITERAYGVTSASRRSSRPGLG